MIALAQLIMKRPFSAALITVVCAALPLLFWISAAAIALVTLRKGPGQGLSVLVWGLLPAGYWWIYQGDPGTVVSLLMAWGMSWVLWKTIAWEKMLFTGVVFALLFSSLIPVLEPEMLAQLSQVAKEIYIQINPEVTEAFGDNLDTMVRALIVGSMATTYLVLALASVLLARYWQSALYNPDGYQKELYEFRLKPVSTMLLLASIVVAPVLKIDSVVLLMIVSVPMLVAGLALVHGVVAKRNMGGHWLLVFYASVLILGPSLLLLLVIMAVFDSWFNFRARLNV